MLILETKEQSTHVFHLEGDLVAKALPILAPKVDGADFENLTALHFDMGGVGRVDSRGIGALVGWYHRFFKSGLEFRLLNVNEKVMGALKICNLDALLNISPTSSNPKAHAHWLREALWKSYEYTEQVVSALGEGLVGLDPEGRILFANPVAEKLIGRGEGDLLGLSFGEAVALWDSGGEKRYSEKDNPVLRVTRSGKGPFRGEFLIGTGEGARGKNDGNAKPGAGDRGGGTTPVEVIVTPILSGKILAGAVVGLLDVTDCRLIRNELVKAKEQWEKTFDAVPDLIAIFDTEHRIVRINKAMAEKTGVSAESAVGGDCHSLLFCESCSPETCSYLGNLQDKKEHVEEISGGHLKGDFILTTSPLYDSEERPVGGVHVVRDVSSLRKAERSREKMEKQMRQTQKMEAIGQLAGGVAHDFNNLLQVILGCTDMSLKELAPGQRQYSHLSMIKTAGEQASELTRQLLAFGRRQVLEPKNLDLNKVCCDMMKMLRRVIGEDVELEYVPSRVGLIHADPGQIEQILVNLCVNARDAMPDGGSITIRAEDFVIDLDFCRAHTWARQGRYVRLSVADSGCGMDEETCARIFEPFFTTKEVGKGTGLGLATIYGIVKQHEGFIDVHSEVGKGTEFEVYFSRVEGTLDAEAKEADEEPALGGRETILLAEDNSIVQAVCRRILERAGYKVLTAANGEEALAVFQRHRDQVDMVLLDIVMPKMNGREVFERLKKTIPAERILFCSGYSGDTIHTRFIMDEGLQLIRKPYKARDLLIHIRKILDRDAK